MAYALSFINDEPGHAFDPMFDMVHVDEKWFHHDRKMRRYHLLPDEEPPQRQLRSANKVEKTVVLAAVARPRFGLSHCIFVSINYLSNLILVAEQI